MNLHIWKRILQAPYGTAVALSILVQGFFMALVGPLLPILPFRIQVVYAHPGD